MSASVFRDREGTIRRFQGARERGKETRACQKRTAGWGREGLRGGGEERAGRFRVGLRDVEEKPWAGSRKRCGASELGDRQLKSNEQADEQTAEQADEKGNEDWPKGSQEGGPRQTEFFL